MVFEISMVAGAVAYAVGIVIWIFSQFSRIKAESKEEIIELLNKDLSGVGRSLDNLKEQVKVLNQTQDEHAKRISQADTIFIHMDDTMKGLSTAVVELNRTLNTLQIVVARLEERKGV